jgi:hypothetical protein
MVDRSFDEIFNRLKAFITERYIAVDPNYSQAYWQISECKKRFPKERTILPGKHTVSKKAQ